MAGLVNRSEAGRPFGGELRGGGEWGLLVASTGGEVDVGSFVQSGISGGVRSCCGLVKGVGWRRSVRCVACEGSIGGRGLLGVGAVGGRRIG